jgi:hypothetical protein
MGSGGLIVMDDSTCMVDIARFFTDFVQSESCGKCVPCRVGTRRMLEILTRICNGEGEIGDVERLDRLGKMVLATSLCGLGQTAPNPALSTIRYFQHEYDSHINERRCPAGACQALIGYRILEDTCTGLPGGSDLGGEEAAALDLRIGVHQVRGLPREVPVRCHCRRVNMRDGWSRT